MEGAAIIEDLPSQLRLEGRAGGEPCHERSDGFQRPCQGARFHGICEIAARVGGHSSDSAGRIDKLGFVVYERRGVWDQLGDQSGCGVVRHGVLRFRIEM